VKNIIIGVLVILFIAVGAVCADAKADDGISQGFKDTVLANAPKAIEKYGWMLEWSANDFNIPAKLGMAIIMAETHADPNAVHDSLATGLMGIKPDEALVHAQTVYPEKNLSNDLHDPFSNIRAGMAYLAVIMYHDKRYNTFREILVAYKDGPGTASRMSTKEINNNLYVKKVLWIMQQPVFRDI